jgi:dTDP-glucose 4,6-dehydratase
MGKRLLVTGGLGFMGSVFSKKALESGFSEIKILDNFSYAADPSRLGDSVDDIEVIRGDIRDFKLVVKESKNFDYVVNFAAETHNDNSIDRPTDFFEVNSSGVLGILQAARVNGFHFHQISTDEVFGDLPLESNLMFDEDSKFAPSPRA